MRARIHLRRWDVINEQCRRYLYAKLGIRVKNKCILTDRYTIKFHNYLKIIDIYAYLKIVINYFLNLLSILIVNVCNLFSII